MDVEELRLSRQGVGQRQACVPTEPQRCYRAVAGHLRVEQSDDAGVTWQVAWEVSDARREELARRFPNPGDIRRHFASRDLVVYPPPAAATRCWSPTGGTASCTGGRTADGNATASSIEAGPNGTALVRTAPS